MEKCVPVLVWSCDPSGFYGGYDVSYVCISNEFKVFVKRVVLLNAVVPYDGIVLMRKADIETVKTVIEFARYAGIPVESYIGHESTARLLTSILGIEITTNRAEYRAESRDYAIVVRLRKRLPKPSDIKELTIDDLEFWLVYY